MFSGRVLSSYRFCRCCHAETKNEVTRVIFKGLEEICLMEGIRQTYSVMIKDVLGIDMKPHLEVKGSYAICRSCINRLIDVVKFKKQVLECEKLFYEKHPDVTTKVAKIEIKEESIDIKEEKQVNMSVNEPEKKKNNSRELISSLLSRSGLVVKKVASDNISKEDTYREKILARKRNGRNVQQPIKKAVLEISIQPNNEVEVLDTLSISSGDSHKDNQDSIKQDNATTILNDDDFIDDYGVSNNSDNDYFNDNKEDEKEISAEPDTSRDKKIINNIKRREEKRFCCEYCSYTPRSLAMLKRHLRTHTNETPFICDICNRGFRQKSTLQNHLVIHSGDKPNKCHICERGFSQRTNLLAHIKYFHDKKRDYVCPVCNNPISNKSDLVKHLRRTHKIQDLSTINMKEYKVKS